ncbi:DNA helicase, partial [Tanacetum coccineum]
VENRGNEDRNYVPISRVFDRFRSMRTTNIGADCMAQTVEQHFGFAYTVENRGDEDRYCVAISRVFNRFRNMCTPNIRADSSRKRSLSTTGLPYACVDWRATPNVVIATVDIGRNVRRCLAGASSMQYPMPTGDTLLHPGFSYIPHNIGCRIPSAMLNHAYLCLDLKDGVIRPATISFPNIVRATSRHNHRFAEYSRDNTKFVHNEGANARKRKNTHPLLIARPEEASPSRNIKRHFIPTSPHIPRATADRDNPIFNSQSLNSNSPHTKDDTSSYMDLDEHNGLVRLFRTTRDRCNAGEIPRFKIRLYNIGSIRGYELPTFDLLGGIVFENGLKRKIDFDVIIEFRALRWQRQMKRGANECLLQISVTSTGKGVWASLQEWKAVSAICSYSIMGDRKGITTGSKIMLPSTFTGGPRYMYSHYLDALAIYRSFGNPQFFITFTCNVKWPEIKRYMAQYPQLTTTGRAIIVCRVFEQKVKDFVKFLKEVKTFGYVSEGIAYSNAIYNRVSKKRVTIFSYATVGRFQKLAARRIIDKYISAEIPDHVQDPKGYKLVTALMMHGPCGAANSDASCMQEESCNKHFPKNYNDTTFSYTNGHTQYRRRDTEVHVMKGESKLDNCNVVPYNRALCLAFEAHINVEYCGSSMLIKYLFKYISKGPDRILENISNSETSSLALGKSTQIDEILNYVDVNFRERDRLDIIVNLPEKKKTTLTEWFVYNIENTDGRHLTYLNFPSELVWYPNSKQWQRRQIRMKKSLERLTYVHPSSGDLFYFRMLLCHQKGCRSPIEVHTINGQTLPTYRAACEALDPLKLWTKYWETMRDDIPAKILKKTKIPKYHVNTTELQGYILYEVEKTLNGFGKSVTDFGLELPSQHLLKDLENKLLMKEKNYKRDLLREDDAQTLRDLMNAPDILFGGKTIVLGGDFRQTLPVKKGATKEKLIAASIAESYLWEIGEPDKENDQDSSWITIPPEYSLIPSETGLSQLIDFIYDDATLKTPIAGALQQKAIVCPKNQTADAVNAKILSNIEAKSGVANYATLKCKPIRRFMQRYKNDHKISDVKALKKNVSYHYCIPKNQTRELHTRSKTISKMDLYKCSGHEGTSIMLHANRQRGKESEFSEHHFEFIAYNQLASRIPYRDENSKMIYPVLTDYLGCIRSISDATPFRDANTGQKYRRKVDIENLDGNILEFTMWDEVAKQFNKEEIEKLTPPVIIAVSSCRVTKYKDLQLTATPATYYYINPWTPEAEYVHAVYDFKAIATDGTATAQFTFFTNADDIITNHPCTQLAQKYKESGAGKFVVDDVLDIQTAVATHTTDTGTILTTSSTTTTKESNSKYECPQGSVLDTSSTTTTGVVLATSPTRTTGEPTNKDTEIPCIYYHSNNKASTFITSNIMHRTDIDI